MSGSKLSDASSSHPAGHDEPLPLTVYALPVPDEAMRDDSGRRVWQGRWKMIIVALVCAAPVIASGRDLMEKGLTIRLPDRPAAAVVCYEPIR